MNKDFLNKILRKANLFIFCLGIILIYIDFLNGADFGWKWQIFLILLGLGLILYSWSFATIRSKSLNNQKLEQIILELQTGNPQQRETAAYQLSNFKEPMAVFALINAYSDVNASVRQNIVYSLSKIASKEATDFLSSKNEMQNAVPIVPSVSIQISELENQIINLESHKKHLEKSVSVSTMIFMIIGVFSIVLIPVILIAVLVDVGILLGEEPEMVIPILIVAAILTIPVANYVFTESKRKDKEALGRVNEEIQVLGNKLQAIKSANID